MENSVYRDSSLDYSLDFLEYHAVLLCVGLLIVAFSIFIIIMSWRTILKGREEEKELLLNLQLQKKENHKKFIVKMHLKFLAFIMYLIFIYYTEFDFSETLQKYSYPTSEFLLLIAPLAVISYSILNDIDTYIEIKQEYKKKKSIAKIYAIQELNWRQKNEIYTEIENGSAKKKIRKMVDRFIKLNNKNVERK